jgi:hypothetical protein
MDKALIVAIVISFLCTLSCIFIYKFTLLKKNYRIIKSKNILFEKYFNSIEDNKVKDEESIHKENFIKFLSESRDWAYEYIENVQNELNKFVDNVDPIISYFDEYGHVLSVERPEYIAMTQISKSYKELKKLLPEEKV